MAAYPVVAARLCWLPVGACLQAPDSGSVSNRVMSGTLNRGARNRVAADRRISRWPAAHYFNGGATPENVLARLAAEVLLES